MHSLHKYLRQTFTEGGNTAKITKFSPAKVSSFMGTCITLYVKNKHGSWDQVEQRQVGIEYLTHCARIIILRV